MSQARHHYGRDMSLTYTQRQVSENPAHILRRAFPRFVGFGPAFPRQDQSKIEEGFRNAAFMLTIVLGDLREGRRDPLDPSHYSKRILKKYFHPSQYETVERILNKMMWPSQDVSMGGDILSEIVIIARDIDLNGRPICGDGQHAGTVMGTDLRDPRRPKLTKPAVMHFCDDLFEFPLLPCNPSDMCRTLDREVSYKMALFAKVIIHELTFVILGSATSNS